MLPFDEHDILRRNLNIDHFTKAMLWRMAVRLSEECAIEAKDHYEQSSGKLYRDP
jgi:hypothetical protein